MSFSRPDDIMKGVGMVGGGWGGGGEGERVADKQMQQLLYCTAAYL